MWGIETYLHGSHTVFSIHLHLVWIEKCRKKLLTDEVSFRVRDMIREICRQEDVEIIKWGMCLKTMSACLSRFRLR
ncbi:MAG: transposase [Candidatus Electronema sp. V4]|uniref:transposase n=1 Tax=Candidatus Electronema sp. V4 TaxID=3454756 RepID=UPI0040558140